MRRTLSVGSATRRAAHTNEHPTERARCVQHVGTGIKPSDDVVLIPRDPSVPRRRYRKPRWHS